MESSSLDDELLYYANKVNELVNQYLTLIKEPLTNSIVQKCCLVDQQFLKLIKKASIKLTEEYVSYAVAFYLIVVRKELSNLKLIPGHASYIEESHSELKNYILPDFDPDTNNLKFHIKRKQIILRKIDHTYESGYNSDYGRESDYSCSRVEIISKYYEDPIISEEHMFSSLDDWSDDESVIFF